MSRLIERDVSVCVRGYLLGVGELLEVLVSLSRFDDEG